MELIEITKSRKTSSGKNYVYYGKFKCPYCDAVVETDRSTGKKMKSCGCKKKELISKATTKHGGYGTKLYKTWSMMKERCNKSSHKSYKYYGKKGITICEEWEKSFEAFKRWSLENGYKEHLQIDRINNNDGYFPENCRWVTAKQNARNKSNNITNEIEVKYLRELKKKGASFKDIQQETNISWRHLYRILSNEIWKQE